MWGSMIGAAWIFSGIVGGIYLEHRSSGPSLPSMPGTYLLVVLGPIPTLVYWTYLLTKGK